MSNNPRATKKQQELLEYVTSFIREHDYGPSYREIMRALDYKSVSTVAAHIDGLIAKGFLTRKDNSARSLEVVHMASAPEQKTASFTEKVEAVFSELPDEDKQAVLRTLELLHYDDLHQKLSPEIVPSTEVA